MGDTNFKFNFLWARNKAVTCCTYCCYVKCATLIVRLGGNALAPKQAQFITMHSKDFQIKALQLKVWLSAIVCYSMAKINDLWDWSMDKRKVCSLVPCCGQDGNRAQVLQHPIDSYNI